ncbi:MAG: NUDIX domain-containing protein [Planctomycetes bacterium]|nr:NUDIX domain-containing protein [Planctomycetota bacterium]
MADLQHRVRLFLYRFDARGPSYLLLRRSEGVNPTWGPVDGPIQFHEQIETAIHREVCQDVGLPAPRQVVDLQMPQHWLLGDEEVIEWSYGVQVPAVDDRLVLEPRWSEGRWAQFSQAYAQLCLELDRAAVTRLHTWITAA